MDRLTKVYNMVGYTTYVFKLCAFDITKKPFQPNLWDSKFGDKKF
jgi:hypothetical protein